MLALTPSANSKVSFYSTVVSCLFKLPLNTNAKK